MNKFESFVVGTHLSDYPEDWSYSQIIDELKSGDDGFVISPYYLYDGIPPEDMAVIIEDMKQSLQEHFA